jgi:hypothetical protein
VLPYRFMGRKAGFLQELEQAARTMVQGSLSESTRQCGDPSCVCAHDPACRHGPHLYFRYKDRGKVRSVYVPPEAHASFKDAQSAWQQFQELGAEASADNRERLLRSLEHEKQEARARRARARQESSRD